MVLAVTVLAAAELYLARLIDLVEVVFVNLPSGLEPSNKPGSTGRVGVAVGG